MTKTAIDILSQLQLQGAKIGGLSADSRALHAGDAFVAYPGASADGRRFIADAVACDAAAVLWEREGFSWNEAWLISDNPRSEDSLEIITGILEGVLGEARAGQEPQVIVDRREAIAAGIAGATSGDVVLIAGKGHEDYQESADRRIPFLDAAVAAEAHAAWTQ